MTTSDSRIDFQLCAHKYCTCVTFYACAMGDVRTVSVLPIMCTAPPISKVQFSDCICKGLHSADKSFLFVCMEWHSFFFVPIRAHRTAAYVRTFFAEHQHVTTHCQEVLSSNYSDAFTHKNPYDFICLFRMVQGYEWKSAPFTATNKNRILNFGWRQFDRHIFFLTDGFIHTCHVFGFQL